MSRMVRGIDSSQEVDPGLLLRDTRTLGRRIYDFMHERGHIAILIFTLACASFIFPVIADIALLIAAFSFMYAYSTQQMLPFRMPKVAHAKDYNDIKPGSKSPNTSRGITYIGNDVKTNEELWLTNEDMRTHMLIFGSTGSGKTEALISIAYNTLVQGSGFIYVDGKGDNSLYAKIFSMVRSMGREDDLLLVNFMTGARDIVGPQEKRISNTLNPFATGSSSMLSQLVVSLMDSGSQGSSDADMWKGRAIAFVEALMKILVYMRDKRVILLDANSIRNYFVLSKIEQIVIDNQFPRNDQEAVSLEGTPKIILEPLKNYLINLPGYNKEKKGKQVSQVFEQHGFITMQLTRVFSSLADTYGHILRTKLAEVDFKDVVLNRRILVVLLPALEKSPDELSNLGKIVIASLKAMMAAGLGEEVEGDYQDIILNKPTNCPTPYMCLLDEYGYYAVEGFAVVPAQARSLGFSIVFAGQDLPAFQKASKEEAASIGANTNVKICMKLEDPTETLDFFTKTAGEAYVTKVDSFQTNETSVSNSYLDTKSSSFEKRARIDLLDLKDQREGEAHIFFRSKIVRARMFYANPKPVKRMKVNQFIKVDTPHDNELYEIQKNMRDFEKVLSQGDIIFEQTTSENDEDIKKFEEMLTQPELDNLTQISVNLLNDCYHRSDVSEDVLEMLDNASEDDVFSIFQPLKINDSMDSMIKNKGREFSLPLINMNDLHTELGALERFTGKSERSATRISAEIIKDMKNATHYPPQLSDEITVTGVSSTITEFISHLQKVRSEVKKS